MAQPERGRHTTVDKRCLRLRKQRLWEAPLCCRPGLSTVPAFQLGRRGPHPGSLWRRPRVKQFGASDSRFACVCFIPHFSHACQITHRDLVSVDTYSLESGLRARATARKVAGALAGKRKGTFAALPGRESDLVDDWEDDRLNAAAAKAKHDAVRVARMIARDPHDQSLLESAADLINQS